MYGALNPHSALMRFLWSKHTCSEKCFRLYRLLRQPLTAQTIPVLREFITIKIKMVNYSAARCSDRYYQANTPEMVHRKCYTKAFRYIDYIRTLKKHLKTQCKLRITLCMDVPIMFFDHSKVVAFINRHYYGQLGWVTPYGAPSDQGPSSSRLPKGHVQNRIATFCPKK